MIIITGLPTIMVMITTMMVVKASITTIMILLMELQAVQTPSAMAAPAASLSSSHLSRAHFHCMSVRFLTRSKL
jgi:hypothetical protein